MTVLIAAAGLFAIGAFMVSGVSLLERFFPNFDPLEHCARGDEGEARTVLYGGHRLIEVQPHGRCWCGAPAYRAGRCEYHDERLRDLMYDCRRDVENDGGF